MTDLANFSGIAAYHPPHEVSTEDLIEDSGLTQLGARRDCLSEKLGITHVRFGNGYNAPSDYAAEAGRMAIERANLRPQDIDALLYCGIFKDAVEPATACFTAEKLGMDDSHLKLAADTTNACHGMTAAIDTCEGNIRLGKWNNVLVCTGEVASARFKILTEEIKSGKYTRDQVPELEGFFSCGDVGAAVVLSRDSSGSGIVYSNTRTSPQHAGLCQWGDVDDPFYKVMDMKEISKETVSLVKRMSTDLWEDLDWHPDDVKYLVQHQVGKLPYLIGTRLFGVPRSRCPEIFSRKGNLTSGSIPAILEQIEINKGDKVLISSTGSGIAASQMALVG